VNEAGLEARNFFLPSQAQICWCGRSSNMVSSPQ
jgi:hypothetical protein